MVYSATKPPGFLSFTWIRRATPIITPEAQEHRAAGRVLLRATFNADGTITDIEIINQVDYMTDSAVDALRRSKFRPATINGVPITVRRVPVYIDVHY
jgi:TonB family protein